MTKGTVKFFNESKGFGFITEEGTNKEHFVHVSGLIDEIREKQHLMRSPQVLTCFEDYLAGKQYPLETITHL